LGEITATRRDVRSDVTPVEMPWSTFEDSMNQETWVSGSTGTVRTLAIPGRAAGPAGLVDCVRLIFVSSLSGGSTRVDGTATPTGLLQAPGPDRAQAESPGAEDRHPTGSG
jgi:hypothetical protein